MSDIMQGITLEVLGEGASMGPLDESMRQPGAGGLADLVGGYRYPVPWRTLAGYLTWLEDRGVTPNVASFVGAGTLRVHVVGYEDRAATADEVTAMCALLEREMLDGALGVASALIYPPETAYRTDELVSLATVAGAHGGMYASHIRSEGPRLLQAVTELIDIARRAEVRAEIYHLKAAGSANWPLLPAAIELVEAAREKGLAVTADAYPYDCSGTSLSACFPPWMHEGGPSALRARLEDPATRERVRLAMAERGWENPFFEAGPENIRVLGPLAAELTDWTGRSLADLAPSTPERPSRRRHGSGGPQPRRHFRAVLRHASRRRPRRGSTTLGQLLHGRRVAFLRGRGTTRRHSSARLWRIRSSPRSLRARRATSAPVRGDPTDDESSCGQTWASATAAGLPNRLLRGHRRLCARVGRRPATPEHPHRFASGMVHVLVNGTAVVTDGQHTGALPGRVVAGPGQRP